MHNPNKKDYFLDSEIYSEIVKNEKLVILDGGSRGDLFEPFNKVAREKLLVIGFEPDPNAKTVSSENSISVNRALWNETSDIKLHLAADPSTSSVYPPAKELLEKFEDTYGYPVRKTAKEIFIPATTIDNVVEEQKLSGINLLKLDIHSAEFEALQGAEKTLRADEMLSIIVETWTSPIHQNQHLHGECEVFLNKHGFVKFGTLLEACFYRKHKNMDLVVDIPQVVGYDSIFFKNDYDFQKLSKENAVKLIALADAFGFISFAFQINDGCLANGLFSASEHKSVEGKLLAINKKPDTFSKIKNKAKSVLRRLF